VLDIDASTKAARFVRTCDAFQHPAWLTFVDVPGFPAGDRAGVGRDHPPRRQAAVRLRQATVPKITLITRKAYGGAYDVMSSKHLRADFNFAWPTAEIRGHGTRGCGANRVQGARSARAPHPRNAGSS